MYRATGVTLSGEEAVQDRHQGAGEEQAKKGGRIPSRSTEGTPIRSPILPGGSDRDL